MGSLVKNLIAGAIVGSIALIGAVAADDSRDVRHKIIEIKTKKGADIDVMVEADGHSEQVVLTPEELNDPDILESKLAHLDDETRETVMSALSGISVSGEHGMEIHKAKVITVNKGAGEQLHVYSDDVDVDFEFVHGEGNKRIKKHIVIGDHDGVIKGHSSAIVSLIDRGEFSQEELDKIQAAVDAKR